MFLVRLEVSEAECNKHDGLYQINTKHQGGETACSIQVNIKGNFIWFKFLNNYESFKMSWNNLANPMHKKKPKKEKYI